MLGCVYQDGLLSKNQHASFIMAEFVLKFHAEHDIFTETIPSRTDICINYTHVKGGRRYFCPYQGCTNSLYAAKNVNLALKHPDFKSHLNLHHQVQIDNVRRPFVKWLLENLEGRL